MSASFDNIYNAIMTLKSKVTPDDEVVFYFSGHGSTGRAADGDSEVIDEAIVVHDGNPDGQILLIWDGQLKTWFEDFPTSRVIFIFDSCYSGGMTDLAAEGRIVAMASEEREFSLESAEWGHGQFTYYFLEGINLAMQTFMTMTETQQLQMSQLKKHLTIPTQTVSSRHQL